MICTRRAGLPRPLDACTAAPLHRGRSCFQREISSLDRVTDEAVDRRMRRAEQDRFIRGERPVRTVDGSVLTLDRSEDPGKRFSAVTGGHAAVELVERPSRFA